MPIHPAATENKLERHLACAAKSGEKLLLPYITAGFPNLDLTSALLKRIDKVGCRVVEIGFPFSDSIADGPVIQSSFFEALDRGLRLDALLAAVSNVRGELDAALVAMVSVSLVRRGGIDVFARRLRGAGFDGWIVPDVPIEECESIASAARVSGLCNIMMAAPTTPSDRRREIAACATGFVYLIGAQGITGERGLLAGDLEDNVTQMKQAGNLPVMVGFGIGNAEQVRDVCRIADGAIVGSAIVRRVADAVQRRDSDAQLVETVGRFVEQLQAGALAVSGKARQTP